MQQQRQALALLLVALTFGGAAAVSASASARTWLRAHPAAQQDDLAELRDQNPDAYALVKALLTKRSLGLLDPKHPTASFAKSAAPPPPVDGAAAFALSPEDQEATNHKNGQTAEAYPEAPAAAGHHDWLNWKASDSAMSDEAMVNNVLGAVANLAGSKKSTSPSSQSDGGSAFATDEAALAPEAVAAPVTPVSVVAPVAAAAPPSTGNSYLKDIDFGTAPVQAHAAAIQGNSYLRGVGLTGKADAAQSTGGSTLATFSFDDDSKPAPQPQPTAQAQPKKKESALNAFSSWLNSGKSQQPQQAPVAAAKPVDTNPYAIQW